MASREVTRYTTWEEYPEDYINEISVTDAAPGVSLVLAEDYDRVVNALTAAEEERDRLRSAFAPELIAESTRLHIENDRLRKALHEAQRMLKHFGSKDIGGMQMIESALQGAGDD